MAPPLSKSMLTSLTTAALAIPGIAMAQQNLDQKQNLQVAENPKQIDKPKIESKVDDKPKEDPSAKASQSKDEGKKLDSSAKEGESKSKEKEGDKSSDSKKQEKEESKESKDTDTSSKSEDKAKPKEESKPNEKGEGDAPKPKKDYLSWANGKDITADLKYTYYTEDGPRYKINVWQGLFVVPINNFEVRLNLERDAQSGATTDAAAPEFFADPTSPTPLKIVSTRSGPTVGEDMTQIALTTNYYADKAKYSVLGYYSTEHDTTVPAVGLKGEWYFNKNNTVLKAALGGAWEDIKPTQVGVYRIREGGKNSEQRYFVALKQDLSKYNYIQFSGEFQHYQGFLNDPYKVSGFYGDATGLKSPQQSLFISPEFLPAQLSAGVTAISENRPRHRNVFLPVLRFVQYVPWTKGSVHFDYRYAADTWKLNSNMFTLAYYQPLPKGWELEGRIRYYSQNRAYFYAPDYNITNGPSPLPAKTYRGGPYASDYRLSGYGTLNYEIKLSYQVVPMMNVSVLGGYYKWRAAYKMGSKDPLPNPETAGGGVGAEYISLQFDFKF